MSADDASPYRLQNVRAAAGHYLLGRGAGAIAGLASAVLLVRNMQVREYAGYTAIMGIAGIVAMLASLGVDRVVTRFVPEAHLFHSSRRLGNLVWRLLAARMLAAGLLTIGLAAAWPWVMRWFDFIALQSIPVSLAVYLLATATAQFLATVLQALVRQRLLTRINVLQWGGRLFWIVLLVEQGGNISLQQVLWLMALPEVAGAAVLIIAAAAILRQPTTASGGQPAAEPWPLWSEVRHLAKHSYGFNILASLPQGYFMRTLVAATLPVDTVAAYGFFSNLIDRLRMYLPMRLMYNLVEPVMVARYLQNKDAGALIRNAQFIYTANVLILVAVSIFVAVGGADLLGLLTKGRFLEQAWILLLLLLQVIIGSHVLVIHLVLNVLKANQLMSKASFFALFAMLTFLFASILTNHKVLILYGVLVYEIAINIILLINMRGNRILYKMPLRDNTRIVISGVMFVLGANLLLDHFKLLKLIEVVGVAAISVVLFVLLCAALNWIDIARIRRLGKIN